MTPHRSRRRIPEATVERLPIYLQILAERAAQGIDGISSDQLADIAGVNAAKVRKDLSYLGTYGTRGVGYEVNFLMFQIRRVLGLEHNWPVVIVGAGNLGQALAGYGGFGERGFPVGGIVDIDDSLVGTEVAGVKVRHVDDLGRIVADQSINIGVVATPAVAAQTAANLLVAAGITSILNFAPVMLTLPIGVSLRKVDLSVELQILSYHEQRRANIAAAAAASSPVPMVPGRVRRSISA